MEKKKASFILGAALAAIVFVGCGKGEDTPPKGETQESPQITGSIQDRTEGGGETWTSGDAIGVYMLGSNATVEEANRRYTATPAGQSASFAPAAADQTLCFPADGATRDFAAYYPHATIGKDNLYKVEVTDQSSQAAIDLMGAAKVTGKSKSDPKVAFVFEHKLVKLNITIKADGVSLSDNDLAGTTAAITHQQTQATYDVAAGGEVTVITGTPADIPLKTAGLKAEGIVLPNSDTEGMKLVFDVPAMKDQVIEWAIKNSEGSPLFKAGKAYSFTVTINSAGETTVEASGPQAWTSGSTTEVKSYETFTATELKQGDYYYSDGTWSDGGLRKRFANGESEVFNVPPVLKDASDRPRTVIGIVYWVGDPTAEDEQLKKDHPGCTHGLIIPLKNALEGSAWSEAVDIINIWANSSSDRGEDKTDITVTDKIHGYANTKALTDYNNKKIRPGEEILKVLPIDGIEQFKSQNPTPAIASGWYWPSIKELEIMLWGDGTDPTTKGFNFFNEQFGKVKEDYRDYDLISPYLSYFWSSSELGYGAWVINTTYGSKDSISKTYKNLGNFKIYVRAICAF